MNKRTFARSNFVGIILHEENNMLLQCALFHILVQMKTLIETLCDREYLFAEYLRKKLFQDRTCKDTFLIHIYLI